MAVSSKPLVGVFIYPRRIATPPKYNHSLSIAAWSPVRAMYPSPVLNSKSPKSRFPKGLESPGSVSSTASSNFETKLKNNLSKLREENRKLKEELKSAQSQVRIVDFQSNSKVNKLETQAEKVKTELKSLRTQVADSIVASKSDEYFIQQIIAKERSIIELQDENQLILKRSEDRAAQDLINAKKTIADLKKKLKTTQAETEVATRQRDVFEFLFQSTASALVNVAISAKLQQMILGRRPPDERTQWRESFYSHLDTCLLPTGIKYAYQTLRDTLGPISEDRDFDRILDASAGWTCMDDIDGIEALKKDFDDNGYIPDNDDDPLIRVLSPIKQSPEKAQLKVENEQLAEENARLVKKVSELDELILHFSRISVEQDEGLFKLAELL